MKHVKLLMGLVLLTIMTSCELAPFEEGQNPVNPEQTNVQEESTMFEEYEQNKTFIFETNDTKYLTPNGYTLWTVPQINTSENFNAISVKVTKESGRTEAGFGLVFCEQNIDEKSFMLAVMINTNGLYSIGKIYDGVFSHINNGWLKSDHIYSGLGVPNDISITFNNTNKNFTLTINNYEITSFTVNEKITFKNSRSGYVVVIANNESFPSKPVRVTYENK